MEFLHDQPRDRGASAVEYGLIVFAVAAVVATIVFAFGGFLSEVFTDSCETIAAAAAPAETCD